MNQRRSPRYRRRLQVQFWQPGEKIHRGYTTNLSATGMHIATADPLPPRSRVRVEVIHGERGFVIEGIVAHRRAVNPELAKVTQQGMGVRFLSPDELIRHLFLADPPPAEPPQAEPVPAVQARAGDADGAMSQGEAVEPARAGSEEKTVEASRAEARDLTSEPDRYSAPSPPEEHVFSLHFASATDFLGVFRRDLVNGGLFVATGRPGKLGEFVSIDLHPPSPGARPVRLQARVVKRFEPQQGSGALLVGMGVELLDLPGALARLQPLVAQFGG
jgi:hypothetical protein